MKILVAEDDRLTRQGLIDIFENEGYETVAAANGKEALARFVESHPDVVCLDIMMPDISGYDVCREIRRAHEDVPILFISAKSEEIDKVLGLEIGADDYIVKPFGYKELVTRVQAALSRARRARGEQTIFEAGNLQVNLDTHDVKIDSREVALTPTEFQLLSALVQDAGRTVSHDTLLRRVWGPEYSNRRDYLKLYIWYLRQKIEEDPKHPKYILGERGIGYRFKEFEKR